MITIQGALKEFKSRFPSRKLPVGQRDDYFRAIQDVFELNQRLFEEQGKYLGNFTSHGPDHSARVMMHVLSLYDQMKKDDFMLTPKEFFVLGLTIYLHDLGMTDPLPYSEIGRYTTDEDRWSARRKRHADVVEIVINREGDASLAFLKRLDPILFNKFLTDTCRAHSAKNFQKCAEKFRLHYDTDPDTRYQLIAGLLLLADEMDLIRDRARMGYPHFSSFSPLTKAHWWKHWLVENCYLDGTVFRIVHVSEASLSGSGVFQEWTIKKLKEQLILLQRELDPLHTSIFSKLVFLPVLTGSIPEDAPTLSDDIIDLARKQLHTSSSRHHQEPIEDPICLIDMVDYPDQPLNPSGAFDKIIWPNIAIFRGQGVYSAEHTITGTYVWVESNRAPMEALSNTLVNLLEKRREIPAIPAAGDPHRDLGSGVTLQTRNLWPIVGEIGVGKTHFLQMLLLDFRTKHPELYNKTLMIHCEAMGNNMPSDKEQTLLNVKREIAKSLFGELERVVTIDILLSKLLASGLSSPIPRYQTELDSYSNIEIDRFIEFIANLINGPDGRKILGERSPIALCLFLDNSDRLPEEIVFSLHQWCYNLSGAKAAVVMTFYRPGSYDKVLMNHQSIYDHISWRTPYSVQPPDPYQMLSRRIEYLITKTSHLDKIDTIEIPDLGGVIGSKISIKDTKQALNHLCQHLLASDKGMLPNLAGNNMRLLLQTFIRILSSWIMDSRTFFINLTLRKNENGIDQDNIRTGWPRMLEALILGHRRWYNPKFSPVENLLHPPAITYNSDYFVAIHLLQLIEHGSRQASDKGYTLASLQQDASETGYSEARTDQVLQWLSTKDPISIEGNDYYQMVPLIEGTLPNNKPFDPSHEPYLPDTRLKVTTWGSYHLNTLVYQLRYWKHVLYTTVIPQEIANQMHRDLNQVIDSCLFHNLDLFHKYLLERETAWFENRKIKKHLVIKPIIKKVIDEIKHQKSKQ